MPVQGSVYYSLGIRTASAAGLVEKKGGKKGKGAKVRHSRYRNEGQDYSLSLKVLGWLIMLIFAPVLGTFAYSVVKDPLTPRVARGAWDVIKERTTGYLSRNKEEHNE